MINRMTKLEFFFFLLTLKRSKNKTSKSEDTSTSSSSAYSSTSKEAQTKFGNAKAISSDQYFGGKRDSDVRELNDLLYNL